MEYYYTYYSYEEWGRGYFGSRRCKCLPEKDIKYFGSHTDKTFKPTQKIILKSDYATREEAYADEIILQEYYKVVENSHFANRAYQTSTSFSRLGSTWDKEHREKLSNKLKGVNSGEKNPMYGKRGNDNPMYGKRGKDSPNYGKKRTKETREKMSASSTGRIFSEEHKKNLRISKNTPEQKEISRKNGQKLKGIPLSEAHKEKLRLSCIGKNKGSLNGNYGKTWYTDGIENKMDFECPEGFWLGYTNKTSSKKWKLIFKDGSIIIVDGLATWCRDNGYNPSNVKNVHRKRIKGHKDIISVEEVKV